MWNTEVLQAKAFPGFMTIFDSPNTTSAVTYKMERMVILETGNVPI